MIFNLIFYGVILCFVQWLYSLTKNPNMKDARKRQPIKKKVVVIGSGVSGIACAKELLADGHDVQIFDKAAGYGGVWKFDTKQVGQVKRNRDETEFSGQVWQNLITTSSTSVSSFSDFYPRLESVSESQATVEQQKQHPFHMSSQQYYEYISDYIAEFKIAPVINVKWEIETVRQNPDKTWEVAMHKVDDMKETQTVHADWVVVASGQHQTKNSSPITGMDKFKGTIVHNSDYINAQPFTGKNVLIIGGGDSGADIVKHVSDVAAKTFVSLRHGAHVTARYFHKDKFPMDYAMFRFSFYLPHFIRTHFRDSGFDKHLQRVAKEENDATCKEIIKLRDLNGLKEEEYFTTKSAMMCEAFANGSALMKTEVATMTEDGARFKPRHNDLAGDDKEIKTDFVIVATGFTQSFGFLPKGMAKHEHLDRYKLVFHPELANMAFIGFVRPSGLGSIPPLSEMQSRWVTAVVGERVDLPSPAAMREHAAGIKKAYWKICKFHNQMLVNYAYYANDLAGEIGCRPYMFEILKKDPSFWWKLLIKPFTLHQFRLFGVHSKYETAKSIIEDRISMPEEDHLTPVARTHPLRLGMICLVSGILSQLPGMQKFENGLFTSF